MTQAVTQKCNAATLENQISAGVSISATIALHSNPTSYLNLVFIYIYIYIYEFEFIYIYIYICIYVYIYYVYL